MADLHRRRLDGEKSGRGMLAFRCRKSLDFSKVAETSVLGTRKRENEAAAEDVSPRRKAALPEKHAILESFYEGVEAAVSLLGIRRELCTFQAVCASVEATTKRRFLQKHLAQIKYILPEAIGLEYVRSYDADTRSNKWELKISLLPLPAEAEEPAEECAAKKPKSESVQRRRAFYARLVKFAETHSEEDDVPAHPMPERMFTGSAPLTSISSIPTVTTCIPMEINTGSHRVEVPKCSPAQSSHFSKSFSSCFSLKSGSSFIRSAKKTAPASPDTILPMPINRTSHRDIYKAAEIEPSESSPHLAPSFKPFFSVKQASLEAEEDSTPVADIPLTPSKRSREIVDPAELQTSIKIIRTTEAPEFESSFKKPHASYSVSSIPSTPVKPSICKGVPVSWGVKTPGRTSDQDDDCSGLKTPVKSSIPANPFKSPAPHQHTPCTPQVTECPESSIHHACHDGFKSPAVTPLKQGSAMRSLFGTPKSSGGGSPGMDVPSTPVNPSRSPRFRGGKGEAKQNLGSLYGDGGAPSSWRKSLSFASEVSEIDI